MGHGNESSRKSGAASGKILGLVLIAAIFAIVLFNGTRQPEPPPDKPVAEEPIAPVAEEPVVPVAVESVVLAVEETPSDPAEAAVSDQVLAKEEVPSPQQPLLGRELYLQHCAACHGEKGDGKGIAAQYLFPKPRNFQAGRFRLVSTTNGVPTKDDLDAVLQRGMPGSSMPPWKHLPKETRQAIAEYVMQLRRDSLREQYIKLLVEEDELTDEELAEEDVQKDIQEHIATFSVPGESSEVPEFGEPENEAVARGKAIYLELKCHSCHGKEGKGDGAEKMVDVEGYPTRPNDYTRGIFKGGYDFASLYLRVRYGMPGTPMPSSSSATPEQVVDLVHFLRSLSTEEARQAAVLKRERLAVRVADKVPTTSDKDQWKSIEPVRLRMTPLWWRENADPGLEVQAVHDGKTIAFRLSWQDQTHDQQAVQSQTFEDAIALELYRGNAEPFVGMGSRNSPVDVWFWDADRQKKMDSIDDLYVNAVVDVYPFSEKHVDTAEMNRPGVKAENQPDISLPAKASGNPIVPSSAKSGASTLTAGGPGTSTFRMPKNQLVEARGEWQDGRWSVLMTRSLGVDSEGDGISLKSGDRVSVAFAIWDGSQQERDGKKLITIWQDLVVE